MGRFVTLQLGDACTSNSFSFIVLLNVIMHSGYFNVPDAPEQKKKAIRKKEAFRIELFRR